MSRLLQSALLLATLALLVPAPAVAQEPPPATDAGGAVERAERLTAQGTAAYRIGQFEQAVQHYQAAYELFPAPTLIFNLAQCHRKLQRNPRALFLYRAYLNAVPAATNRPLVESLITTLSAGVEKGAAEPGPAGASPGETSGIVSGPPAPVAASSSALTAPVPVLPVEVIAAPAAPVEVPPPAGRAWYRRWYVWAGVAAVVAGVVVGGIVGSSGGGSPPPMGDYGRVRFGEFTR